MKLGIKIDIYFDLHIVDLGNIYFVERLFYSYEKKNENHLMLKMIVKH